MKILKPILVTVLCCFAAMAFRAGVRRFAPKVYASVWGQTGSKTLLEERAREKDTGTVAKKDDGDQHSLADPEKKAAAPENPIFTEKLEVRGYAVRGSAVNVFLSDGSTLTEKDKDLERIERNSVTIRGQRYALKAPPRPTPTSPESPGLSPQGNPSAPSAERERTRGPEPEAKASPTDNPVADASAAKPEKSSMSQFDSTVKRSNRVQKQAPGAKSFFP